MDRLFCHKCGEIGKMKTEPYGMFHHLLRCENCSNTRIEEAEGYESHQPIKTLPEEQPVLTHMNQQQFQQPSYAQQPPAQPQQYGPAQPQYGSAPQPQYQQPAPSTQQQAQNDQMFAPGVRMFDKHPNAPDFVLASMVITPAELFDFVNNNPQVLSDYNGQKQLKLQIKRSQSGAVYAAVDTYQKGAVPAPAANNWGAPPAQHAPAANGWAPPAQQPAPPNSFADKLPF